MAMTTTPNTLRMQVTLDVAIPVADWIDWLTRARHVLDDDRIGHWARGWQFASTDDGLLLYTDPDHAHRGNDAPPGYEAAGEACAAGEPLPAGWYHLDRSAAIRAYVEGVKLWGVAWFTSPYDCDHDEIDHVVQRALLGEYRYPRDRKRLVVDADDVLAEAAARG